MSIVLMFPQKSHCVEFGVDQTVCKLNTSYFLFYPLCINDYIFSLIAFSIEIIELFKEKLREFEADIAEILKEEEEDKQVRFCLLGFVSRLAHSGLPVGPKVLKFCLFS